MDQDKSPPGAAVPPVSTAIMAGPVPGCPVPLPVAPPANALPVPIEVRDAWPRSAQAAMAFLLGAAVTLLALHSLGHLRHGSRPLELERSGGLSYRVDLNHARRAELLQLPGVGSNIARRIEDYRQASGGFRSVEDLTRIQGIGPATLERLRPWVTVEEEEDGTAPSAAVDTPRRFVSRTAVPDKEAVLVKGQSKKTANLTGRIDINHASADELRRLPGIGPKLSQRIVDERDKGHFRTVDELRRVAGIGAKTLERLRPYISVQGEAVRLATAE